MRGITKNRPDITMAIPRSMITQDGSPRDQYNKEQREIVPKVLHMVQ